MAEPIFPEPARRTYTVAVLIIVLLAGALRFNALSRNPTGMFRDELDKGFTTLCLLETGMDQSGARGPIFVRALRVTTSAVYEYLDMLPVAVLGLNETAIRLPAAMAGTLAVAVTIFFARKLWGTVPGLLAGLLLATSPWHVLLSRWANQSILLTLWIPLGLWAWMISFERKGVSRWLWMMLAVLGMTLALYSYAPARMVVPLIVAAFFVIQFIYSRPADVGTILKCLLVPALLMLILAIPLIRHVLGDTQAGARFSRISIFDGRPWIVVAGDIIVNYISHFSPGFLVLGGDANPRHSAGFPGGCHLVTVLGAVLGVWRAFRLRDTQALVITAWLFLGPAAAAFTNEGIPHALRAVMMLPAIQILAVGGLVEAQERWGMFYDTARPRATTAATALVGVAYLISLMAFFWNFWMVYPQKSYPWWEGENKILVEWHNEHAAQFSKTIITGTIEYPQPAFLVYGNCEPRAWIETQQIPGVEFLPLGRTIQSVYRSGETGVAFVARADEHLQVRPYAVLRDPYDRAIWAVYGKPLEE